MGNGICYLKAYTYVGKLKKNKGMTDTKAKITFWKEEGDAQMIPKVSVLILLRNV